MLIHARDFLKHAAFSQAQDCGNALCPRETRIFLLRRLCLTGSKKAVGGLREKSLRKTKLQVAANFCASLSAPLGRKGSRERGDKAR